jgi:hypothetical protein
MFKRFVALTSSAAVCAAMFISVCGCGDKKPATPANTPSTTPSTTPEGGETKPMGDEAPK